MHRKVSVILYTRAGCHLCEVAKKQMIAAGCADLYELEEIDIDSDSELSKRYGTSIPVIAINGMDVFRHRVTAAGFRDVIQTSEAGDSKKPGS